MWTVESAIPGDLKERIARLAANNAPPFAYMAAFLEIVSRLKTQKRTGWIDRDVPQPESIADHMYRMGVISMLSGRSDLDIGRCVQIALVHDIAESIVGDITPYADVTKEEKHRRELEAIIYIRDLVSNFNKQAGELIYDLWNQYENQTSPEAVLVKDIDKFELLVQASEYQIMHPKIDLSEFRAVKDLIKTDEVKEWADGLESYTNINI